MPARLPPASGASVRAASNAHRPQRIGQQRGQQFRQPVIRRASAQPRHGGRADLRRRIGQRRRQGLGRRGAGVASQLERGRGPHDVGQTPVADQPGQVLLGRRFAAPCGVQHIGKMLAAFPVAGLVAIPLQERLVHGGVQAGQLPLDRFVAPAGGQDPVQVLPQVLALMQFRRAFDLVLLPVQVAPRAGVRRPQVHAQVRPRDPQAVVAAGVDLHVRGLRHVALDAQRSRRVRLMVMVGRSVVLAGRMLVARGADLVGRVLQLRRMRIVAVGAADAPMVHLALDERRILEHLVQDLAVGVVGRPLQQLVVVVV